MSMPGRPIPVPRGRVIAYIDGFNLYYGLKESDWRRYLWLDSPRLRVPSFVQIKTSLRPSTSHPGLSAPKANENGNPLGLGALGVQNN